MNIFVTGGTGFLGRCIVEEVIRQGCTPSFSARRLNALTSKDLEGIDAVIHSAALKPGPHAEAEYKDVNAEGTRHLAEACAKAGVRRFVHISSMSVAAERKDAYSASKREAERHVQASGLRWTIVRPGAVYGPSEWWISYFRLMKKKRLVPVIGDGEHLIYQIYVNDCARAIARLAREESSGNIYNASAEPIPYNHYLSVLKASLQANFRTVHIPMWVGQVYAAGMRHVLGSPRPQFESDPRRDLTTGSASTLDCGARTFESGLAEMLPMLASEDLRRSRP